MKKWILALATILFSATFAFAQTATTPAPTPSTGLSFTSSAEATALDYAGAWTPATHVTESMDILDFGKTKTNHINLEGHEIVASGAGFNSYLGGVRYTPDLTTLLKKTNIPATGFGAYFQGAVGNTTFTSKSGSNFSGLLGAGIQYKMTSSLTWSSLHIAWLRVGGQNAVEMSTGLQYVFTH